MIKYIVHNFSDITVSYDGNKYKIPINKYNGSFGFHGYNIDFTNADIPFIPY